LNPFWLRADVESAIDFWRASAEDPQIDPQIRSVDFRPALGDGRLFPHDAFRRVSARQQRQLERKPARTKSLHGNQGNFRLREAITVHIAVTRGVACRPDDVLVTSGAQQAFDILAKTLVKTPGTVVAIEDPGYPPMRVAFAGAGAVLAPVPVDEKGLIVDQIPPEARVICVCPSHQFPLGVTMSPARRQALIELARKTGAVIIEDDYDGEFRYEGSPLEALRTADAADVVFYVGTFSKSMLPSLRLGFVIAPDWAIRTLTAAKNCLDWYTSALVQTAVAAFISDGHLIRHVRKMRHVYGVRRQLLLNILSEQFGEWLKPIPSFYGTHVTAVARGSADMEAVSNAMLRQNVRIHSFARYYLGPQTISGLIFGYGDPELGDISEGLSRLRAYFDSFTEGKGFK
jgi:GntR family transcriptional regulator/MocR family aminotransferase